MLVHKLPFLISIRYEDKPAEMFPNDFVIQEQL